MILMYHDSLTVSFISLALKPHKDGEGGAGFPVHFQEERAEGGDFEVDLRDAVDHSGRAGAGWRGFSRRKSAALEEPTM